MEASFPRCEGFLPTPSARRATVPAPRVNTDPAHFYPRPPRGGRPVYRMQIGGQRYFYPRPPRGGRPI